MSKKATLITILVLFTSNITLFVKLYSLEEQVQYSVSKSELKKMLEQSLISTIDVALKEREIATQRRDQKSKLISLLPEFELADKNADKLIYGNPNARISIRMFGDIECPFCRKIHKELKRVVDHSQGVINWEYKHFPLSFHNPSAAINAQAIECIAETHDNQKAWVALTQFVEGTKGNGGGVGDIPNFVRSFGLNGSMVKNCLESDSHKGKINKDYAEGLKLNVRRTPAIQIVDSTSSRSAIVEGYQTSEQILSKIQQVLNQQ